MAKKYIIGLLILFSFNLSFGKDFDFLFKYPKLSNIQEDIINDIEQDKLGFIWISTSSNGLYKYDGNTQINYLPGENVQEIKIAKNGDIYASTKKSIYKFNSISNNFKKTISFKSILARDFYVTENNIFFGKSDTVYQYNISDKTIKFLFTIGIPVKRIVYHKNEIFGTTSSNMFKYSKNQEIEIISNEPYIRDISFINSSSDTLIYANKNVLYYYNIKSEELAIFEYPDTTMHISDIQIVGENVLICSNIGVFNFNFKFKKFEKIYYSEKGLKQYLLNILWDNSNSLWIGTSKGFIKSYPKDIIVKYDLNDYIVDERYSSNFIFNMKMDAYDNLFYLTSEAYLVKKDSNDILTIYKPFKNLDKKIRLRNIYMYDDSTVFISVTGELYKYNYLKDELKLFCKYGPIDLKIHDKDNILISDMKAFMVLNSKGDVKDTLKIKNISFINKLNKNHYQLFSKQSGLIRYDIEKRIIIEQDSAFTDDKFVKDLYWNFTDSLVYMKINTGLKIINLKTNESKLYTNKNGLLSNEILGFLRLHDYVYVNTSNGISIFKGMNLITSQGEQFGFDCYKNTEENKFWKYNYINRNLLVKDSKNRIYIGGRNGVNAIMADKFFQKSEQQPMYLTSIKIFGEEAFSQKVLNMDTTIVFSYKDNIISFDFAAMNYQLINKNRYSFFLENYNKNWEYPVSNSISYRSLDPGEYKLKTRYSDYTGNWFDGPRYNIIINPPFWKTKTFLISLPIFLGLLVFGIIKLQTYRIKAQKTALEYRVVRRTHELQKKKDELENINENLEVLIDSRTKKLHEANEKLIEEFAKKEQLLSQLQESQEQIELNLKQQTILSSISMDFISLEDFYEKLKRNLKNIAQNLNLENVYLFEDKHTEEEETKLLKWSVNGSDVYNINSINYLETIDLLSVLHSNEIVIYHDVNSDQNELLDSLKQIGIHSILTLPIIVNEEIFGFIGSTSTGATTYWDESIINLFQTLAHIIGNAFERKIFQSELLEKEKTSKALLNASDSFAILFDVDGKIRLTNMNFLKVLKKDLDQVVGTSVFDYFPYEKLPQRQDNFNRCIASKKHVHYEDEFNGEIYSNNVTPIIDRNGEVIRVAHFSHNITKQKEAERILKQHQEELQKEVDERTKELRFINQELLTEIKNREKAEEELLISEKAKRENLKKLALQLAHEIKNPLSSINSSAQLVETIQMMNPDVSSTIKHMRVITKNVDTCNRVIKELYHFTHDQKLELTRVPTEYLISELVEYGENKDQKKNIKIKCVNDAANSYISLDKFKMLQALKNIIANSIDAIENNGEVTIELKRVQQNLKISIKDTGKGIDDEKLKKIFEPFYTSKSKGFGLGLAIVEKIIERHSGKIDVSSELGKGTVTVVTLPGLE